MAFLPDIQEVRFSVMLLLSEQTMAPFSMCCSNPLPIQLKNDFSQKVKTREVQKESKKKRNPLQRHGESWGTKSHFLAKSSHGGEL